MVNQIIFGYSLLFQNKILSNYLLLFVVFTMSLTVRNDLDSHSDYYLFMINSVNENNTFSSYIHQIFTHQDKSACE